MITGIDETHDPALRSWVASANADDTDFGIQNLPFGRFRGTGAGEWRAGVAIGDRILDLQRAGVLSTADIEPVLALDPAARRELRHALSHGLRAGSDEHARWGEALVAQSDVELGLPCHIGDYTDFYAGIHHATAVGALFRPDNPLLPNYKWVPIGYHGRASTIRASGHAFHRPQGQSAPREGERPGFGPSKRLDYELEMGIVIGRGNAMGTPIAIDDAEDHVFGITLLNDWSARDLQAWEYQPLGPFLAKNFATTLSPWIVTLEALAPFRTSLRRPASDPAPLAYLDSETMRAQGAFDIDLEVWLQTARMRREGRDGDRLCTSNFAEAAYWTTAQLVTHHAVNGCELNGGDVLGTGTLSGPRPEQAGSLLELTRGGKVALKLGNGEERTFLEDGDTVTLRAYCEREGYRRIGFGACTGTVLA